MVESDDLFVLGGKHSASNCGDPLPNMAKRRTKFGMLKLGKS
ncbi:hypothetical protein GRAN_1532 [Granulicella sibirica]|uniref:Uncharacterized protein n=1 Tax=Granulicella sibirica TaxID=2479048 RepID=A0A4Q0T5K0_9BACT|nr:hypothetical protein GRAN_1532 [Granulicella sibirica]